MVSMDLVVIIDSGNNLLPYGTKRLAEPMWIIIGETLRQSIEGNSEELLNI